MKIEMGESLFYSWLRHVKECQIVQNNWKVSSQWTFNNSSEIEALLQEVDEYFEKKYDYKIFKKNASLSQIIQQGECDVLGISVQNNTNLYYAVDVAFHEAGLNYGTKQETIMKIISKSVRTAFCLYGFLETKSADIVFASPKINRSILEDLIPCIDYLNSFFKERNFDFCFRLICNEEFNINVLQPILLCSDNIADTSELFMRSYQMYSMFNDNAKKAHFSNKKIIEYSGTAVEHNGSVYQELKIGKIVQTVLRKMLQDGRVSADEIEAMQTAEYSKKTFDIQYPLLVKEGGTFDKVRYYSNPLMINGRVYYLCSQWFETSANNDRPYLINWINKHDS